MPDHVRHDHTISGQLILHKVLDPGVCPAHDPGFAGVTALRAFKEVDCFMVVFCGSGFPAAISTQWIFRGWEAAPTNRLRHFVQDDGVA
jgi:hypothetical protein